MESSRAVAMAVALGGTVTVIDVDMRFEWSDEMLRRQKLIFRPGP